MSRQFAEGLYKSQRWRDCRAAYAASKGYLCERCLAMGIISTGEIVHHKKYITPDNISDPMITLNWDNLELVCRECHAKEHHGVKKRYTVDEVGRVSPLLSEN